MSIDTQTRNDIDLSKPPHLREMTDGEVKIRVAYVEMSLALERTTTVTEVDVVANRFQAFLDDKRTTNEQPGLENYLALAERRLHQDVKYRKTYLKSLK